MADDLGSGGGGKYDQYLASMAAAQKRQQNAISNMLEANAKNRLLLGQKTWETQLGSCTNNGQRAIFESFSSEWFARHGEIGIADSYEEYLNYWGAKANRLSLSAASITAITGQLSIGYSFNISLGFSLFGDQSGHTESQVLSILDYIDSFLGALSQKRGFSEQSRKWKGPSFPSQSVKGFGAMLDAGLGEAMGGGSIRLSNPFVYRTGRSPDFGRAVRGRPDPANRSASSQAARRADLEARGRGFGDLSARSTAQVTSAAERAAIRGARYVIQYGRFFII